MNVERYRRPPQGQQGPDLNRLPRSRVRHHNAEEARATSDDVGGSHSGIEVLHSELGRRANGRVRHEDALIIGSRGNV